MPIGSNTGIVLPAEGDVSWGTTLNNIFSTIISFIEGYVPASAVAFSADIDCDANGFRNVSALKMVVQGALLTGTARYLYAYGNNLYYVSADGTETQITTDGHAVNTGSIGSIVDDSGGGGLGAYGASGIEVRYDGTYYRFRDGTGSSDFASVRTGNLKLHSVGTSYGVVLTNAGNNASFKFPADGVGGSARAMQISSSGLLTFSGSIAAMTLSAAATMNSTLSCTVLSFSTARAFLLNILGYNTTVYSSTWTRSTSAGTLSVSRSSFGSDTGTATWLLPPIAGTASSVRLYYTAATTGSGSVDLTLTVYRYGTGTTLGTANTTATATNGYIEVTGLSGAAGTLVVRAAGTATVSLGTGTASVTLGGSGNSASYVSLTWD